MNIDYSINELSQLIFYTISAFTVYFCRFFDPVINKGYDPRSQYYGARSMSSLILLVIIGLCTIDTISISCVIIICLLMQIKSYYHLRVDFGIKHFAAVSTIIPITLRSIKGIIQFLLAFHAIHQVLGLQEFHNNAIMFAIIVPIIIIHKKDFMGNCKVKKDNIQEFIHTINTFCYKQTNVNLVIAIFFMAAFYGTHCKWLPKVQYEMVFLSIAMHLYNNSRANTQEKKI